MRTDRPNVRGESRFLPNTAALTIHTVFATLITLLQVKILAAFLAKETFGLFASLRGLSLLVATLAANGLPQLLVRFFPELESKQQGGAAVRVYSISIITSLGFLAVAYLIVGGTREYLFAFMPSGALSKELLFWFWVTVAGWALKLIVYGGLNGIRRLTIHTVLDIAALAVQLGWIFIERGSLSLTVLFKIMGVVAIAEAFVGAVVIVLFLARAAASDGSVVQRADPSGANVQRYITYWGWAVGLSIVAVAFTDVDRYLLSQVITLEMLALFHIGARITRLANRLLGVPNLAFQPEITRLEAEDRPSQIVLSTRVFMKFGAAVAAFIAATLIAFAGEIITIVANPEYMGAAPLLLLLALAMPLSAMTAPLTSVMKALDKVRSALYCDLVWACTYVCLLLLLGSYFGIIGAGYAQLLACMAQLLLASRLSRLPMKLRFATGLGSTLAVCSLVAFAPLFIIEIVLGWTAVGMITVLKVALFVFALFMFKKMVAVMNILTGEERAVLIEMLEKRGFGGIARFALGRLEN
ncbi:MAG: hypothetical protein GTO51_04415 [Candidatus Latescibacteria bacterium]|nr:hypothetical protein [Candidatus Latescibacterota bacterium]NIM21085.1 hypothetical protein [Candidatus Latescibacterota bacterium]NIM65220.1 hypothetical protein [Candidatus Latescibacterota bacterium]NIO01735.1 hypothetical protein [Candidatus Latescibacterota bacterium]NIO28252.1 hypothetical protein [Candidatus Latescibacterota bacterium]